jgi:hypothetical protein
MHIAAGGFVMHIAAGGFPHPGAGLLPIRGCVHRPRVERIVNPVEIPKPEWSSYLDQVTRTMADAEFSIELAADPAAAKSSAAGLSLQYVAYLPAPELFEVAGGSRHAGLRGVFHHIVERPRSITVDAATLTPWRIEVDGGGGQRVVIKFERP